LKGEKPEKYGTTEDTEKTHKKLYGLFFRRRIEYERQKKYGIK